MAFTMRTSIHGRRLGLSSTGGIITGSKPSGAGSTLIEMAAQMWGPGIQESIAAATAVASTLVNYGISTISSASATAIAFEVARPEIGVYKEIHIDTSASEISMGGTSTAIIFASTVAVAAASTAFFSRANLAGTVITLRGKSTAEWIFTGSTASVTIG